MLANNAVNFSPLQVKNKPHEGAMNVRLYVGLLPQQQTSVFEKPFRTLLAKMS
jgi:hypothetical protein